MLVNKVPAVCDGFVLIHMCDENFTTLWVSPTYGKLERHAPEVLPPIMYCNKRLQTRWCNFYFGGLDFSQFYRKLHKEALALESG